MLVQCTALILSAPQFRFSSINFHITGYTNINIDWLSAIYLKLRIESHLVSYIFDDRGNMLCSLNYIYVYYVYMPWIYLFTDTWNTIVCGDFLFYGKFMEAIAKEAIQKS